MLWFRSGKCFRFPVDPLTRHHCWTHFQGFLRNPPDERLSSLPPQPSLEGPPLPAGPQQAMASAAARRRRRRIVQARAGAGLRPERALARGPAAAGRPWPDRRAVPHGRGALPSRRASELRRAVTPRAGAGAVGHRGRGAAAPVRRVVRAPPVRRCRERPAPARGGRAGPRRGWPLCRPGGAGPLRGRSVSPGRWRRARRRSPHGPGRVLWVGSGAGPARR